MAARFEWVGSGQVTAGPTLSAGAILEFASGYVGSNNIVPGRLVKVVAGGTQSGGAVLSGGVLDILSGGIASGVTLSGWEASRSSSQGERIFGLPSGRAVPNRLFGRHRG